MADLDLAYTPAVELARLIRTKAVSPVAVVENALRRIAEINPKLNAFCFVYADEALATARAAEAAVTAGRTLGPLHGVPVAIKDLTPTKGKRTTMGSRLREHWVPDTDAIVVERLLAAGAIMIGKTTTPEFAYVPRSGSPLWGTTRNPWDQTRTPGMSSMGSAAAVATGCVPLAEGSDMGGSIRNPAAYCSLVGLKPSFGRIPFEVFPSQFDQTCHFGPLARTVDDAALFLRATEGPDDRDIQAFVPPAEIPVPVPGDVRGLRLAFSPDLGYAYVDPEIAANIARAVDALRDAGATVDEVALGLTKEVAEVDSLHWDVYSAAMLRDELAADPSLRDQLDPLFLRTIDNGFKVRAVDLKRCEIVATKLWKTLRPVFAKYAALLCPSALTPALKLDFSPSDFNYVDSDGRYRARALTSPFNLVGRCPALAVPTGFTAAGLPTGIQIVGRRYDDVGALRVGKALEAAIGWPAARPPI